MKLNMSDDTHFESYIGQLLDPKLLATHFGYTCFEEETRFNGFQAQLLDHMCALLAQTQEHDDVSVYLSKTSRKPWD